MDFDPLIQRKRERFSVEISCGNHIALGGLGIGDKYQRVIHRGIGFDFEDITAVSQSVAHGTMHLRNAA